MKDDCCGKVRGGRNVECMAYTVTMRGCTSAPSWAIKYPHKYFRKLINCQLDSIVDGKLLANEPVRKRMRKGPIVKELLVLNE